MKLLIINPGSTSTKLALYEREDSLHSATLQHGTEELASFERLRDQYRYRLDLILAWLQACAQPVSELAAVVGRGGILRPIPGGTYRIGALMLRDLEEGAHGEHASNLGALLAHQIASAAGGIPSFIVDPVVVDEMEPYARLSGLPAMPRRSLFHALNQKAVARRCAREMGRAYEDVNLVVAHLGGGVTVGAHQKGRVIDVNNGLDGEGPMSPERAGTLPTIGLVELAFSWRYTQFEVARMIVGRGGFVAHLGTNDAQEVERRVLDGDEKAALVYRALAHQVAKEVGRASAVLRGKVDRIILTGGLAHSELLTGWIGSAVAWVAPVALYPGEDEMQALAEGALRVLRGEERAREYG